MHENGNGAPYVTVHGMKPEQFLQRCKMICHVGPAGVWDQISKHGFRTAEQLILAADLTDEAREQLLSTPRRESVLLHVRGDDVTLRDQGSFFARKEPKSTLGNEVDVSDLIHLLNQRVYFFTDQTTMEKHLDKYVQMDGPQDVIWLSPLKVLQAEGIQLELATQNAGAIARRSATQNSTDAFVPLFRFPDKRPAELTAFGGFDDLEPVFRAERYLPDGERSLLT
jgi:hypothetical protein